MNEELKCPKCDDTSTRLVGMDKSLMPRLLNDSLIGVGDLYQDINILQCSNCGCRFLSLSNVGFIKKVTSVSSASEPRKYHVETTAYNSFASLTGSERREAITKYICGEKDMEDSISDKG